MHRHTHLAARTLLSGTRTGPAAGGAGPHPSIRATRTRRALRPQPPSRRTTRVAAALLAWVALACGGEPFAEGAVSLRFADADALARTSSLSIQFFRSDNTGDQCTRLRATRPRPRADLGPYRQALDDIARREGSSLRRDDVPVGNWVILVDATDADGNLVGVGCAQGQQVLDGQRTSIAIVIDAAS